MPDLEQLLRDDGAAWRSSVDAHHRPALEQSANRGRPARRVHWRAPLAAVLITILIAATTSYLATRGGHSKHSPPALPVLPTTGARVDPLKVAPRAEVATARQQAQPVHRTSAAAGGDNRSMPWRFLALLDHGRVILLTYAIGSPCDRPLGFNIKQGSNAVELAALSRLGHPPGGCEQPLLSGTGTIHLNQPLGNRLLLHARAHRLTGPQHR